MSGNGQRLYAEAQTIPLSSVSNIYIGTKFQIFNVHGLSIALDDKIKLAIGRTTPQALRDITAGQNAIAVNF